MVSKTIGGSSNLSARANKIKMTKIVGYIAESFRELKENVTWPEWAEVQRLTIIVAIFSVLFALFIYGVDRFFVKVLEVFFSIIK